MDTVLEILSTTPLFGGLPEKQLLEIKKIAVSKDFTKGQIIFLEGDEGDGFYVVGQGMVKVFKTSSEGKEQILHLLGPGEPFGEVPVFSGKSFPANAEAISKCWLLFFHRTSFISLIGANPSLALNMLAVLSMRLRQFTVQVENLSLKEVPARLASYLIYLHQEQGGKEIVGLEISKGQLASLLGTVPETLSRIFSKMTDQGLIEVKERKIRLLDPEGLEDLAASGK
ncbi:MAG: Crp/Fnr family transcriptional regulator [Desulfatiglans sp.]|jgi:CRP/FNR family transcriptional regulator|nr:Crp/Fnr family transcriptional regulator [Thermodesulfobacteriota bacterium]MEE4354273.1 Crp/Fnr family transcriptional regulator [Desulfatiglans sp.]